jgi:hypothetical protein
MEHSTTCLIRFGHHIPFAFCQYNLGTCHHNMMLNLDVLRSVGIACKLAHYALVPLPQQIILLILFFCERIILLILNLWFSVLYLSSASNRLGRRLLLPGP